MSTVSAIGLFDPFNIQWTLYRQIEGFFLAKNMKEDRKKVAVLISTVGSQI